MRGGVATLTASIDLPLDAWAPRLARKALRPILTGWGFTDPGWLDSAEIVVSELVTNALRHGGGCLELLAECHDQRVTLTAADGSAILPERRDPSNDGGRGIMIIEMIAEQWGVNTHHEGKRVWVHLAPHPQSHSPDGTEPEHLPNRVIT